MKTKLTKKRAISTVLTTVIILVSSVVLGSGVVLYGTSLFQSGVQTESISVSGVKVWVRLAEGGGRRTDRARSVVPRVARFGAA